MQEFTISIRSLADLLDFVALAQVQPFPVYAGNAHQIVSAQSHMGMCTLDCGEPVRIQFFSGEAEGRAFRRAAGRFLLC